MRLDELSVLAEPVFLYGQTGAAADGTDARKHTLVPRPPVRRSPHWDEDGSTLVPPRAAGGVTDLKRSDGRPFDGAHGLRQSSRSFDKLRTFSNVCDKAYDNDRARDPQPRRGDCM